MLISTTNLVVQTNDAHRDKTCLTFTFPPTVWKGVAFQDRGGSRCKAK